MNHWSPALWVCRPILASDFSLPFQIFFELPTPYDIQEFAINASRVSSLREDMRVVRSRKYKATARKRQARRKEGDIDEAIYQYGKRERRFHERETRETQLIKEFDKTKAKVLQRLRNEREELEEDQHGQDPNQIRQERGRQEEEVQHAARRQPRRRHQSINLSRVNCFCRTIT
ncbi:MAG: hypothetical protein Q9200_006359 [Gallowayella weberi]